MPPYNLWADRAQLLASQGTRSPAHRAHISQAQSKPYVIHVWSCVRYAQPVQVSVWSPSTFASLPTNGSNACWSHSRRQILTVTPSDHPHPDWRISSDALVPKLARSRTSARFFVRALCAHPRLINYLDFSGFGSSHSVGLIQAVRATGTQLTHFVYRAHTRRRTTLE